MFFACLSGWWSPEDWSHSNRVLMLQCVLSRKAQEAFCSLPADPDLEHAEVKQAVLKT